MSGWQQGSEPPRMYWGEAEPPVIPAPPGTVYAGVGVRFVAWVLDLIPIVIIFIAAIAPVAASFFELAMQSTRATGAGSASSREAVAAMADAMAAAMPGFLRASAIAQIGALIYIPGLWLLFSRSPGMALMGLQIVREEDGGRMGVGRVAVRFSGYLLSASFLLLGFAWALIDRRKQTWHDKLAGTVVVRDAPIAVPATSAAGESSWDPLRRPSIGAVVDRAWDTLRRSPVDLFESMSPALVPGLILMVPVVSWVYIAQQDQAIAIVDVMRTIIRTGIDYSFRTLELSAPAYLASAALAGVASIFGSFALAAGVLASGEAGSIERPGAVARFLARNAGSLALYGLGAGLGGAAFTLLVGAPALMTLDSSTFPMDASTASILAAVGALVVLPIASYLSVIWVMGIACVAKEEVSAGGAWRRAWRLSRGRMRWLFGVLAVGALSVTFLLVPLAALPSGLLADAYLQGDRLPTFVMVILVMVTTLLAIPIYALSVGHAYRWVRDAEARHAQRRVVAARATDEIDEDTDE